jgi:magnesium-transporting ATPase (P-type)
MCTKVALTLFAQANGVTKKGIESKNDLELYLEYPFDSIIKRMTVIYKHKPSGNFLTFMKGATEVVLSCCKFVQSGTERIVLDEEYNKVVDNAVSQMSKLGLVIFKF